MRYMATAVTDAGIVKKINQDSLTVKIAQTSAGQVCMAVVCDGLGGLSLGEVASGNVILAFDKWFKEQFMAPGAEWTGESIRNSWEDIIYSMNQKIKEYGASQGVEMGTTITAVLFLKDKYYAIHVGDSRGSDINCKRTGTGNYHERTGDDRQPAQCAFTVYRRNTETASCVLQW